MKKFYYATDGKNGAHVLTVLENENIVAKIRKLELIVAQPCKTYADAVKIVEIWKAAKK